MEITSERAADAQSLAGSGCCATAQQIHRPAQTRPNKKRRTAFPGRPTPQLPPHLANTQHGWYSIQHPNAHHIPHCSRRPENAVLQAAIEEYFAMAHGTFNLTARFSWARSAQASHHLSPPFASLASGRRNLLCHVSARRRSAPGKAAGTPALEKKVGTAKS